MKNRDLILVGGPALLLLALLVLGITLHWRAMRFEADCREEALENVAQEARVVADVVRTHLDRGDLDGARRYCAAFRENTLRVTLVDALGKVSVDSREDAAFLGNHLNREEIQDALAGHPASVIRYSDSLGKWMIYHAVPVPCASGNYVLRTAVSTNRLNRTLRDFRIVLAGSFTLALVVAAGIMAYILRKVRLPLVQLQQSVGRIAAGELETPIAIPPDGVIRELAEGVDAMTGQLRERLAQVTADRNERELLFSAMSECVMLLDPQGAPVRANASAERFFHFTGTHFNISRCQIPALVELVNAAFRDNHPFEQELDLPASQGSKTLLAKGQLLQREKETFLLLTISDLSAIRQLETFRSDFIANVSHEIKTPLTCIIGAAEALDDCTDDEERHKLASMMKRHAERLNRLVADILNLSAIEKLQRDPVTREFAPVQLDALLADVANLSLEQANAAGMKLELQAPQNLTVEGDHNLLEQAVVNLVGNAIKYSNGKNITLSAQKQDGSAIISVRDDGVGIPRECHDRLFERFFRVDKSRSRALGGTGLGLAIVKHTAQLHGGHAEVESTPGNGSTFKIILPLGKQESIPR